METLQQAADFAVEKIVQQGKQCGQLQAGKMQCLYSDGKGNHCAVGWLLNHNDKKLMASTAGIETLVEIEKIYQTETLPDIIKCNPFFFARLQQFHDGTTSKQRKLTLNSLKNEYEDKVDFSSPNWQQWVDMGDDNAK